jgi:Predicted Rossmann fold nucleotide-binding protein involved in DNA uptake
MTISPAAIISLLEVPGIGEARARSLIERAVATGEELRPGAVEPDTDGPMDAVRHAIWTERYAAVDTVQERLDELRARGITVLTVTDDDYPSPLRAGPAPLLLYVRGDATLLSEEGVGFSGSRETNAQGQAFAAELVGELVAEDTVIISGGAAGTDTAAHQAAVTGGGRTVVYLGTGIDRPFPRDNAELFDAIAAAGGAVVSTRPPDAGPRRHGFLDRNGLIAAQSAGIVFVAADASGGTMAQHEIAVDAGTTVMASPPDAGIQPDAGIAQIREDPDSWVVTDAADVTAALRSAAPTDRSGQTQLSDGW